MNEYELIPRLVFSGIEPINNDEQQEQFREIIRFYLNLNKLIYILYILYKIG